MFQRSKNCWQRSKNKCQQPCKHVAPDAFVRGGVRNTVAGPVGSRTVRSRYGWRTNASAATWAQIMAENDVIPEQPKAITGPYEIVHAKSKLFYPEYERKERSPSIRPTTAPDAATASPTSSSPKLWKSWASRITPSPYPGRLRVFAYYYFDVGNVQVAHGRAPARPPASSGRPKRS